MQSGPPGGIPFSSPQMRRAHQRLLANTFRSCGLGACLVAVGAGIFWVQCPDQVCAIEQHLRERLTGTIQAEWRAAMDQTDAARQSQQLEQLLGKLEAVRRDDRLANLVRDGHRRLAELAHARGDVAAVAGYLREAIAFDDHDVTSQVQLADVLCEQPETLREGLERFALLVERPPGSAALTQPTFADQPLVVAKFARHLADNGRAREALHLLDRAASSPTSNLWTIAWSENETAAADTARAELVASVAAERTYLQFELASPCRRLWFQLPEGASGLLQDLELTIGTPPRTIDVFANVQLTNLRRTGQGVVADGSPAQSFAVDLGERSAGALEVRFSARWTPRPAVLLAAPAASPAMGQLAADLMAAGDQNHARSLHRWRLAAMQGSVQLHARRGAAEFASLQNLAPETNPGAADFDLTFAVAMPATELRFVLPAQIGYGFAVEQVQATIDGAAIDLLASVRTSTALHDVTTRNGWWVVTGTAPSVTVSMPADQTIENLRLVGNVR
jgi:hypothetical protein